MFANLYFSEFVFLLKIYGKIFAHSAPIITVMQNPTLDAVQLSSMLEDFAKFGQLRKERRPKTKKANEEPNKNKETDRSTVEVEDSFERETGGAVEEEI